MFPQWSNPLRSLPETGLSLPFWGPITWGQIALAAIAAVPPLIILLYFLKLKRQPLEVPSTYLWHKSIEDLHVNSIWQRLRQSLLLFLQLLLVATIILALLAPTWRGSKLAGNRFIFVIDNSASMAASDIAPSRLDEAKRQAALRVDAMKSGDTAMIVSFSDAANIEQSYTDNRQLLLRRLQGIRQTHRPTNLAEALRVAGGLANPGRSATDKGDVQVADAKPAELYLFSDGKFPDVKGLFEDDEQGFSWGNLTPTYIPIGQPDAENVAIAVFTTQRREDKPEALQAFARLHNYGAADATVQVELYVNEALASSGQDADDAKEVTVPAGKEQGVIFDLGEFESGVLRLRVVPDDPLLVDNQAWAAVNKPDRVKVLCVSPESSPSQYGPLQFALTTGRALELADVRIEPPEYLLTEDYQKQAASGEFELVIYDRCQPFDKPPGTGTPPKGMMPQSNTLFIGVLPPTGEWKAQPKADVPQVIDTDKAHPLTQLVEMIGEVLIGSGTPLVPPPGASVLIDSSEGPLLAIADRDALYQDAVLGFAIIDDNRFQTDWPKRSSFPVFVLNVLSYLGGTQDSMAAGNVQPGRPVTLRLETPARELTVVTPDERRVKLKRGKEDTFFFSGTDQVGDYEVRDGSKPVARFAVNLFNAAESDILPRFEFKVATRTLRGQEGWEAARSEGWKWLLLAALVVLLFEWYIYNRRIYI